MTPKIGEAIFIPVRSERGPFSGECLISFDSLDGPISGFIRADQVEVRNDQSFIRALVLRVAKDAIAVRLHGSFFTTTGLANIDKDTPYLRAAA
jgi:hypothetical protein